MAADLLPGDLADWPDNLRTPAAFELVIAWLQSLPLPYSVRRKKLYSWAKSLSLELEPADYQRLDV